MSLTREEISNVKIEPDEEGLQIPVVANWSLSVNGRKFGEYMSIAREKPRRSILFLPIADPCSLFATIWGSITTFNDFSYTAFVVPLSLAFNDLTTPNAYWFLDLIGSTIYIIDFIFEFHIGFIVRWDSSSVTITDGIQVAKNYARNGSMWIDLISCLPFIAQIIMIIITGNRMSSTAVRSVLLLKLLRLGRVLQLITRMNQVDTGGILHQWVATRVTSTTMFICNTFFSLMVMINLLACMWWWIAETQGLEHSWVAAMEISKPDIELVNGTDSTRWLVCAYYSLVTMATIGYGDIVPVTTPEIGVVIIFIFCGVAYFGFILSTVSALLEHRAGDTVNGGDMSKYQDMEIWMKRFSFPKHLQRSIRKHCHASSMSSLTLEEDEFKGFYSILPLWLKAKIAIEMEKTGLQALVGGSSVWDNLSEVTQNAVSKVVTVCSEPRMLRSSVKLHTVGDPSNDMYFLEEGQLALFVPGFAQVVTISSPAILGSGSLFASWSETAFTWKATVRTATRCFMWKLDSAKLQKELMNIAPEVLQLILDNYIDELKHTRNGLDKVGNLSPPGMAALKQSYDERIQGAYRAADDLKVTMAAMRREEAAAEAARREERIAAEKEALRNLENMKKTGMVEAEIAAETSAAQRVVGGLPDLELQNPDAAATAMEYEADLEQNSSTISQVIEGRLDRRQATMFIEEEASKGAALGIIRKKGITTFVV